jgi:hypothetical protein
MHGCPDGHLEGMCISAQPLLPTREVPLESLVPAAFECTALPGRPGEKFFKYVLVTPLTPFVFVALQLTC